MSSRDQFATKDSFATVSEYTMNRPKSQMFYHRLHDKNFHLGGRRIALWGTTPLRMILRDSHSVCTMKTIRKSCDSRKISKWCCLMRTSLRGRRMRRRSLMQEMKTMIYSCLMSLSHASNRQSVLLPAANSRNP